MRNLLHNILELESKKLDMPSVSDWIRIEKKFNHRFSREFRFFIELMAEYDFPGEILNVSSGRTNGNDFIECTYDIEIKHGEWEEGLIPFYSIGNGDYFCLLTNEEVNEAVYYYSHENSGIEKEADDFQEWLIQLPFFLR